MLMFLLYWLEIYLNKRNKTWQTRFKSPKPVSFRYKNCSEGIGDIYPLLLPAVQVFPNLPALFSKQNPAWLMDGCSLEGSIVADLPSPHAPQGPSSQYANYMQDPLSRVLETIIFWIYLHFMRVLMLLQAGCLCTAQARALFLVWLELRESRRPTWMTWPSTW